jgi:hypothetical protein
MSQILTKKEAIEFLGLNDKIFDNYFRNAKEFSSLERPNGRGRFKFHKKELEEWQENFKWRTIDLTLEDYAKCLDFALAQHFKGYVLSDWGTGRQREFGQKLTNWIKGQLGEIAVQKFLKREFDVEVELDFEIYDGIVAQDIIGVFKNGKKRTPHMDIGIKSSKPKSSFLVLGGNEVKLADRKSDVFIFCRPDLPDDHILRLAHEKINETVKDQKHFPTYKDFVPSFENVPCEIAGYCLINELEEVTEIPGQPFDNGYRYVKATGLLHRSKEKWGELVKKL